MSVKPLNVTIPYAILNTQVVQLKLIHLFERRIGCLRFPHIYVIDHTYFTYCRLYNTN